MARSSCSRLISLFPPPIDCGVSQHFLQAGTVTNTLTASAGKERQQQMEIESEA